MGLSRNLQYLSKLSIRFIYSLYFVCQIASMIVTCFCIFFDKNINTFWLACAIPLASIFVLSIYIRFRERRQKPVMRTTAEEEKREESRKWLRNISTFLFTTNLGLLLLALLSATGQSLSVKAIIDIYYEITRVVDKQGSIIILSFSILVFTSRLIEMYLCKEMVCKQDKENASSYAQGSYVDIARQSLHTFNFAISLGLNTFITLVTLMSLGYYPSMSLDQYYVIILACLGTGIVLSVLETSYYMMSLQEEEDYTSIAVVSPLVKAETSASLRAHKDTTESEFDQTENQGLARRSARDSEQPKDRAGNAMSIFSALLI